MYRLDNNLLTKIYEYDSTYKEVFNVVLTEMKLKFSANPSLNNHKVSEWRSRICKWKHKEPTQVHIPNNLQNE